MAEAERANSTSPSALSRAATDASQINHPTIDRAALMRRAHQIAKQARPHMASYREALYYGLKADGHAALRHALARADVLVAVLRAAEARFTIARAAAASQTDCSR
jgi:hypothetical protein